MNYIDLQVNGYGGVDFNSDDLTSEQLVVACDLLREHQVEAIFATLITTDIESFCHRIRQLVNARCNSDIAKEMIQGIHLEGPFLNPEAGYIGAHSQDCAMPADLDSVKRMYEACDGLLRIVTLAPERDLNMHVTRWLADQGVTVSAGHCNASLDQLKQAIDAGLAMYTHLGNGCPLNLHRHDNIIQRVLHLAEQLAIGFIADGIHIPFFALKNYLQIAGDRAFVVTDAIAAAGKGPGEYRLTDQTVVVDENLATWVADKSHLVGSAMTMPAVVDNLNNKLGLADDVIRQLTRENPLQFLR